MTRTPEEPFGLAQDKIAAAVAQALKDTLDSEDYPERLEPFTEAQLLIRTLVRLLGEERN